MRKPGFLWNNRCSNMTGMWLYSFTTAKLMRLYEVRLNRLMCQTTRILKFFFFFVVDVEVRRIKFFIGLFVYLFDFSGFLTSVFYMFTFHSLRLTCVCRGDVLDRDEGQCCWIFTWRTVRFPFPCFYIPIHRTGLALSQSLSLAPLLLSPPLSPVPVTRIVTTGVNFIMDNKIVFTVAIWQCVKFRTCRTSLCCHSGNPNSSQENPIVYPHITQLLVPT